MSYEKIDVALGVLSFLKDGEYHSIVATTFGVGKYLGLTSSQMKEVLPSRQQRSKNKTLTSTKIYFDTQLAVSHLRKAKFLKNFPKTEKLGFFCITEKGLNLYELSRPEIKKFLILN